jgi:hypothetical protein
MRAVNTTNMYYGRPVLELIICYIAVAILSIKFWWGFCTVRKGLDDNTEVGHQYNKLGM